MLDLTSNRLLIDVFPPSSPQNLSARILRLGLAVNGFSALETYLSCCFDAAVARLQAAKMAFKDFPADLKEFLLVHAVTGLANEGNKIDQVNRIGWYAANLANLAGYANTPPTYSAFGFSPKGSNVLRDDIPNGFKAFQVSNAWSTISNLISSLGASPIDLANGFKQLSGARHTSAHVSTSNIPTSDLQGHLFVAVYIGVATDILLTAAVDCLNLAKRKADIGTEMSRIDLSVRFIDEEFTGSYVERIAHAGPVVKRYPDRAAAVAGAGVRARKRFLVVRDVASRPIALIDAAGLSSVR